MSFNKFKQLKRNLNRISDNHIVTSLYVCKTVIIDQLITRYLFINLTLLTAK